MTGSSERHLGRGSAVLVGVVGSVYERNINGVHLADAPGGADNGALALEFAVGSPSTVSWVPRTAAASEDSSRRMMRWPVLAPSVIGTV